MASAKPGVRWIWLGLCLSQAGALARADATANASPGSLPAAAPSPQPTGLGLPPQSPFLTDYPELRKYLFEEPTSPYLFGFGLSPIMFVASKIAVSISVFQIHRVTDNWDWEVLDGTLGFALSGENGSASRHFSFWTAPKYRIFSRVSIGVLGGYEFVSFPNIEARLVEGSVATEFEPFSASGLIYGAQISEIFPFREHNQFRVTETLYQESYKISVPSDNSFGYRFADPTIDADPDKKSISSSTVFQIGFSILF